MPSLAGAWQTYAVVVGLVVAGHYASTHVTYAICGYEKLGYNPPPSGYGFLAVGALFFVTGKARLSEPDSVWCAIRPIRLRQMPLYAPQPFSSPMFTRRWMCKFEFKYALNILPHLSSLPPRAHLLPMYAASYRALNPTAFSINYIYAAPMIVLTGA